MQSKGAAIYTLHRHAPSVTQKMDVTGIKTLLFELVDRFTLTYIVAGSHIAPMLEAVLWGRHITDQLVLATFARIAPVFAPVLARIALPDCLSNGSLAARATWPLAPTVKTLFYAYNFLCFSPSDTRCPRRTSD